MPELIDREQAGKNICKYCASNAYCKEDDCMVYQGLRDTPTIQIESEPVRHGRWETWGYVFHGIEWKRCSRCGKCADVSYYGLLDGEIKMSTPAICGGCGARMDADHIADVSKKVVGDEK
jgi:predicted Zn-ribbon and HTH transcriptional regulator